MRILFVIPPYRTTDALVAQLYPMPLAAVMLGTVLKKAGHEVVIKDFLVPQQKHKTEAPASFQDKSAPPYIHYGQPINDCRAWLHVYARKFDAVGLFAGQCNLYETSELLAKTINELDLPLVVGGAFVTTATEEALRRFKPTVAVVGEGEGVVLKAFEEAFNTHERGLIIKGRPMDAKELPIPDWSLAPPKNYPRYKGCIRGVLTISRGCPFSCKFCSVWTVMGRRHRRHMATRIKAELKNLIKYGVCYFCFLDDNLFIGPKETKELLQVIAELKKENDKFKRAHFYVEEGVEVRVAAIPGLIKAVAEAGFENIALGIETMNDKRLMEHKKPYAISQLTRAVAECEAAESRERAFYIVGFPGDTVESVCRDFVHFGKLGLGVRANNLKLYPDTDTTREFKQKGWINDNYDWRLSSFYTPTSTMRFKEIKRLKTVLSGIGFAAEEFGIKIFKDSIEMIRQKLEAKGYVFTIAKMVATLQGNMYRPTPYRKILELLMLREGAIGVQTCIHGEGSEAQVEAWATMLPTNNIQQALIDAFTQE